MRQMLLLRHCPDLGLRFPLPLNNFAATYIESRSTDVYVAQCFANGEVGLAGNQALLAWHVDEGSWDGVPLDGLTVAAAVRAHATLGDPYGNPYPAQAVLMVDDAANSGAAARRWRRWRSMKAANCWPTSCAPSMCRSSLMLLPIRIRAVRFCAPVVWRRSSPGR